MNTHNNHILIQRLVIAAVLTLSVHNAIADDLTPPPYRGGPLSVYAHWQLVPGSTILNLTGQNWVDDNDPSTPYSLSAVPFSPQVLPSTPGGYEFQLPNWIDDMPVKYLRIQLTWIGSLQPVLNLSSLALDNGNPINGQITYASPVQIDAAGVKAYQYYDLVFKPNPDFERVQVLLSPNSVLYQAVVDTISTVPEPGTLGLLGLGMIGLLKRRQR